MNIKRNIIFAPESRKKNGVPIVENVPIRMRVIYASHRIEFTTGYRIDIAKWDADKQRVKNGCTNKLKQSASEINADLLRYYAEIQNVFKEFEVQETMPTTQQLKDAFNLKMKNNNEEQQEDTKISFWEIFDEFVKECGNQNNWSLRYSDVRNLKRSDVKSDHIEVTTVKTADSLNIELNKYSKAILEKYKDIHFENNMALPVISNQKMNDYLKELGELAEINEPVRETYYKGNERIDEVTPKYALLSTHAGRRTFICNALALGIPAQVVMKWTGHSDYKAMKPYIDIADDIKANAMNKFNQL